jgi:hypothetical protein
MLFFIEACVSLFVQDTGKPYRKAVTYVWAARCLLGAVLACYNTVRVPLLHTAQHLTKDCSSSCTRAKHFQCEVEPAVFCMEALLAHRASALCLLGSASPTAAYLPPHSCLRPEAATTPTSCTERFGWYTCSGCCGHAVRAQTVERMATAIRGCCIPGADRPLVVLAVLSAQHPSGPWPVCRPCDARHCAK